MYKINYIMEKKIWIFVCLFLLGSAYTSAFAAKVKGNGNIVTKEVNVGEYDQIVIGAGIECNSRLFDRRSYENPVFNYKQVKGKETLSVTIDENLFPLLEINTSGKELSIRVKKGNTINPSRMELNGVSENLQKVSVSGCMDFSLNSRFTSDRLEISISGASDVKINNQAMINRMNIRISGAGDFVADNLTCKEIDSSVSGAGDVTLTGNADNGKFTVTGAGDIKAFDFVVKKLECRVSGAGDIRANATEIFNASVSGTGDIHYKGNAVAETKVSGFGNIKKVGN